MDPSGGLDYGAVVRDDPNDHLVMMVQPTLSPLWVKLASIVGYWGNIVDC